ncbi:MAG: hypothetical protein AAF378_07405 [Cyanobacteria bacterium P01_A01_bin.84]
MEGAEEVEGAEEAEGVEGVEEAGGEETFSFHEQPAKFAWQTTTIKEDFKS